MINNLSYYISQFFVIISYVFLILTYFSKKNKTIIIYNFFAVIAIGISYFFLNAYTGIAMVFIAIIRNIIFMYYNKGKKSNIYTLLFISILIIISTIFTYSGPLSLLSVLATALYTYSVWQKDTKLYKILGVPISLLWISYNVYIYSIFGIILESILLMSAVGGFIKEKKGK